MGSAAVKPSQEVAKLLRKERLGQKLTLREVAERLMKEGERLPESTLTRIEQGKLDPGVRRLHYLMRAYSISPGLVAERLAMEALAGRAPKPGQPKKMLERGVAAWRAGDTATAVACLRELQGLEPRNDQQHEVRQRAILTYATFARNLGKTMLAKELVEGLLCEQPRPELMWRVLMLAGSIWSLLGSPDAAIALVRQASHHCRPDDHEAYAQVLHQEAYLLMTDAKSEQAADRIKHAIRHYRQRSDSYGEVRATILQARIARQLGNPDLALRSARKVTKLAKTHGHKALVPYGHLEAGRNYSAMEDHDAAVGELNRALGLATMTEDHDAQFYAQHALWKAHEARGRRQEAKVARTAAEFHIRYVDEDSPEADEVRRTLSA